MQTHANEAGGQRSRAEQEQERSLGRGEQMGRESEVSGKDVQALVEEVQARHVGGKQPPFFAAHPSPA